MEVLLGGILAISLISVIGLTYFLGRRSGLLEAYRIITPADLERRDGKRP